MNSKEIEWKMSEYENLNYNSRQLEEIYLGFESGINVSKYANSEFNFDCPSFNGEQMKEIRLGLEAKVDVSKYANPKFDEDQMYVIREGLEAGIDVSKYADPKFNKEEMAEIAEMLCDEKEEKERAREHELEI